MSYYTTDIKYTLESIDSTLKHISWILTASFAGFCIGLIAKGFF